jgi:hypothetical protein
LAKNGPLLASDDVVALQRPARGQRLDIAGDLDGANQTEFPIGAQGTAAIYTSGEHGAWAALRKISIRAHSWLNWLYPINF